MNEYRLPSGEADRYQKVGTKLLQLIVSSYYSSLN
jgi:hypothetical protein